LSRSCANVARIAGLMIGAGLFYGLDWHPLCLAYASLVSYLVRELYGLEVLLQGTLIEFPSYGRGVAIEPECTYLDLCLFVLPLLPYRGARSWGHNLLYGASVIVMVQLFGVLRVVYAIGESMNGSSWFLTHAVVDTLFYYPVLILYGFIVFLPEYAHMPLAGIGRRIGKMAQKKETVI